MLRSKGECFDAQTRSAEEQEITTDNLTESSGDINGVLSPRTLQWRTSQGLSLEVIENTIKNIASKICSQSSCDGLELKQHLNVLLDLFLFNEKHQASAAERMSQFGITEKLVEILKISQSEELDYLGDEKDTHNLQLHVLGLCHRFSQESGPFCQELSRFGAVRCLTTGLKNKLASSQMEVSKHVKWYVIILHNIAVNKTDTHDFVFAKTAQVLEKCKTHVDDVIRVASVLTLGHIYSVEDIRRLNISTETTVHLCLEWLTDAMANPKRATTNGFHVWVIILGLARLAENLDFRNQFKIKDGFRLVSSVMSNTRDPKERNACKKCLVMADKGSEPRVAKVIARKIAAVRPMINAALTRQQPLPPILPPKPQRNRQNQAIHSVSEEKMCEEKDQTTKQLQTTRDYSQLKHIDVLLIGKTGNGKSAAGNTILGRRAFRSTSSFSSVTKDVEYEMVKFKDCLIKVVDAPGVADTDGISDFEKASKGVAEKMRHAVTVNPEGYHAFLLVIKYGNRFTAEDQFCVQMLKSIFGEDFVRNFCILLVTCGDRFKEDNEHCKFKEWCREQDGVFNEILTECNNRAILFDNSSKDAAVRHKQVKKLMKTIDGMQFAGRRYTDAHFEEVAAGRDIFLQGCTKPMIREDTIRQTCLLLQDLEECSSLEDEYQIKELGELNERATAVKRRVLELDGGTGALQQPMQTVTAVVRATSEKMNFLGQCVKGREDLAREQSDIEIKYTVKIKRQSRSFDHTFDAQDLGKQDFKGPYLEELEKESSNTSKEVMEGQKQHKLNPKHSASRNDVDEKEKPDPVTHTVFSQRLGQLSERCTDGSGSSNSTLAQMNLVSAVEVEKERVRSLMEQQKNKWQTELEAIKKLADTNTEEMQMMERRLREDFQIKIEQLTNEFEERLKLILRTYELKHTKDRAVLHIMFKEMKKSFDECIKLSSSEEASNCAVS